MFLKSSFFQVLQLAGDKAKNKFWFLATLRIIFSFLDLIGITALFSAITFAFIEEPNGGEVFTYLSPILGNFNSKEVLFIFLSCLILFFLLKNIGSYFLFKKCISFAENASQRLSNLMIDNITSKGYQFLKKSQLFVLSQKIGGMPFEFSNIGIKSAFTLFSSASLCLFFLLIFIRTNWTLSLFLIILSFPIVFFLYHSVKTESKEIGKKKNKKAPKASRNLHQFFENYIEIRVFNSLELFKSKFLANQKTLNNIRFEKQAFKLLPIRILEIGTVFIIALIVFWHIYFDKPQETLINSIAILGIYGYKIMPSIAKIIEGIMSLKSVHHSSHVILNQLLLPETECPVFDPIPPFITHISFRNIHLETSKTLLSQGHIEFFENQIVGLIGISGCGKSTLAKYLMGLIQPKSGDVTLNDELVTIYNNENWLNNIGYVGADSNIIDGSIYQNVCLKENLPDDLDPIKSALTKAGLSDFIDKGKKIGEKGNLLSTGEKQRIALARNFYFKPKFIILDEFSANLDQENEQQLLLRLKKYKEQEKAFILLISHRKEPLNHCNSIYQIENQKLLKIK